MNYNVEGPLIRVAPTETKESFRLLAFGIGTKILFDSGSNICLDKYKKSKPLSVVVRVFELVTHRVNDNSCCNLKFFKLFLFALQVMAMRLDILHAHHDLYTCMHHSAAWCQ